MAARALRSVAVKPRFSATASLYLYPLFSSPRSFLRLPAAAPSCRLPPLHRVRPLLALVPPRRESRCSGVDGLRCFSTSRTNSSLNDPSPNWSNRPPKETILLDGCDFEHWLVVVDPPDNNATRDEIIKSYIQTLAKVVGSEEEARMKIYSVSTKHYFAFGALVSEELSYKIKELPGVRWVLPDSYLDVRNKDYGGEPFINGEAVPYDPKYHEEWVRNNARANERNRRNDRPRNFDRSRNFERRRENMQNFQNRGAPAPPPPSSPVQNQQFANQGGTNPISPNMEGPPPSGGYQQQSATPNPVPSGGPIPNMGAFPNQVTTAGLPNPNMRGNQDQAPNNGGGYGPNFGGYQTQVPTGAHGSNLGNYQGQVPSGAPNSNHSGYQNQGPNSQNYGGGAYQGSRGGYQGYPSGSSGPSLGGGAYQGSHGGSQGYPSGNQGPSPGGGAYQGSHGGSQGYPSGNQGPSPGGGAYQGSSGGSQGYPSGNQGPSPGGFAGSSPPNYQGNPGTYQGSPNAYKGGGTEYSSSNSYRGSGADQFQPREVPGRD